MFTGTVEPDDLGKDSKRAARSAGLRYISDTIPGITRSRRGKNFSYRGPDGKRITDEETLERIRHLAIPPAWDSVWISPYANGHLAATGRDNKGRKQYRYHDDFAAIRDAAKYDRLPGFARTLPHVRKTVAAHLRQRELTREKVLAAVVALLEQTHIRIGNEDYAKANGSYGLTTLRNRHVRVKGAKVQFTFRGKSGKDWNVSLDDSRVARIVRACQDLPGQNLFEYRDTDGQIAAISSGDVNDYLRGIADSDITAKDFRTWSGTVSAALAFHALLASGEAPTKKAIKTVIGEVAEGLGNTMAVCRKCYVHPKVIDAFEAGKLHLDISATARVARTDLSQAEKAVLAFLEDKHPRKMSVKTGG